MTARSLRALMLGALALPFAFATASLAQDHAAPPPPAAGEDGHHHHGWGDPAERAAMMARHLEHQAARLRDILQLRPDQEGALHAFLDSMKPPADMMARMHGDGMAKDGDEADHLTTPQRLDRMLARMDEHRARMAAHAEAVKRFYAQLSPTQQKAFDAMGPMMHGPHGMGGPGMGGPGMGGHHGPMGGPMGGPPEDGPMDGPPPAA